MDNERWLLPEGVDEVLPPQAWNLENLRRDLLNLYRSWGYELVMVLPLSNSWIHCSQVRGAIWI